MSASVPTTQSPEPNAKLRLTRRIVVFDSGLGGLSVVPSLRQHWPEVQIRAVADSAHAPYGERDTGWLVQRCRTVAAMMATWNADGWLLACNTATAAAAEVLRAEYPRWPIIGMEPAIKPAVALTQKGCIGVMATASTLQSPRFNGLVRRYANHIQVVPQECSGLAWAIERGDDGDINRLIDLYTEPLVCAGVDVVVLGCTHYPLVRSAIQARLGRAVQLVDTSEAVARRTIEQVNLHPRMETPVADPSVDHWPPLSLWTSGDPSTVQAVADRWLGLTIPVQAF